MSHDDHSKPLPSLIATEFHPFTVSPSTWLTRPCASLSLPQLSALPWLSADQGHRQHPLEHLNEEARGPVGPPPVRLAM